MKLTRKETIVLEMTPNELDELRFFVLHCADKSKTPICDSDVKKANNIYKILNR